MSELQSRSALIESFFIRFECSKLECPDLMRRLVLASLLVASALGRSVADDDEAFQKRRGEAIDKGVAWLEKAQEKDGSWHFDPKEPLGIGIQMRTGCTAFCALALLKSGVKPDDPVIDKAFELLCASKGPDYVYAAGAVLLAIEARHHWEVSGGDDEGVTTRARNDSKPRKITDLSPRELELAEQCRDFLVKQQTPAGSWTYPVASQKGDEKSDASHPQYALLGLDAAERLGLKVPRETWAKAIDYFVTHQEKEGPEVPAFPVPGADLSYKELARIEKEMRDKIQRIESDWKGKKEGDVNAAGHTEEDEKRTVVREARDKALKTREKVKMAARGWCYAYAPAKLEGWKPIVSGSMTASALCCLFCCKAHLDAGSDYEKIRAPVDKALRDGCAWIARYYTAKRNPSEDDAKHKLLNHYYYMYGLERAGILGLVPRFGEHDWYVEGCKMFLDEQKQDGSWDAGKDRGTAGPVTDTCFALLFLSRGTTPIVKIPTRTATG